MKTHQKTAGQSSHFSSPFITTVLAAILWMAPVPHAFAQPTLYWIDADTGMITRMDVNVGQVENLVNSTTENWRPHHIALDEDQGTIYWTLHSHNAGDEFFNMRILRANLDGTNVDTLSADVIPHHVNQLALDLARQKVYWTTWDGWLPNLNIGLFRANFDGTDIEKLSDARVWTLALDHTGEKIYYESEGTIHRANLDGSDVEALFRVDFTAFSDIALDPVAGKVYGCMEQSGYHAIFRANLDGSELEELVPVETFSSSLTLHTATKKMYWLESQGAIMRANLDGTDVEEVEQTNMTWYYYTFAVGMMPMLTAIEADAEVPVSHTLSAAYPNPFNPRATFMLAVAHSQHVRIDVVDALGRSVAVLHDGPVSAHTPHRFTIDGSALPSGVYIYRVRGDYFQEIGKAVLLR